MSIKIQELAFVLKAHDYLSGVLKNVDQRIEHLNETVKGTARMREAAGHLAMMGAGFIAAGAAIAVPLRNAVERAAEMQDALARVQSTTGLAGTALRQLGEAGESFADRSPVATAEQYVAVAGQLYANLHNVAAAQRAANAVFAITEATGADVTASTGLVNMAQQALGITAGHAARTVAAVQREFRLKPENMTAYTQALARMGGAIAATHTQFSEASALAAEASQLMPGGRGAMIFASLINTLPGLAARGKLPADFSHGMLAGLDQLRARLAGLSSSGQLEALRNMGISGSQGTMLLELVGKLDRVGGALANIRKNEPTALAASMAAQQAKLTAQEAEVGHLWAHLETLVGNALLPTIISLTQHFASLMSHVLAFASAHPMIVKYVAIFAAISAAVLAVLGSVAMFTAGILFMGSNLPAAGTFLAAVGTALYGVAAGFASAAASTLVFLATNPIGWAILAVAGLALVSREVYEHWAAIKAFIGGWSSWLYSAGANLMHSLASGIASAAMAPIHAVARIAEHIKGYVVGHSPPPLGPLHDLNRVHLVETIAATMKPAPMLAAIRRVAQVTAVAMPMMIGAPAIPFAAPGAPGGSASAVSPVIIHYTVNIQGSSIANGDDLKRALDAHAHDLVRTINREREKRDRTKF